MPHQTPESPDPTSGSIGRPQPSIGHRVAGWATNTLASGLILILGVVGGQHALQWWAATRTTAADPQTQVLGTHALHRRSPQAAQDQSLHHLLAFGNDALQASRAEVTGDLQDVLKVLRDDGRDMVERTERVERTPGPAEQRMLRHTHRKTPVESTSRWRMYQLEVPIPMVVTVLDQPIQPSRRIGETESRVVSWGLAFPTVSEGAQDDDASGASWTLFTMTAESTLQSRRVPSTTLPVPPHSQNVVAMQGAGNGFIQAISGTGSIDAWLMFYNTELVEPKWRPVSDWREERASWQRSFISWRGGRLEVQLIKQEGTSLTGLLTYSPPSVPATHEATP